MMMTTLNVVAAVVQNRTLIGSREPRTRTVWDRTGKAGWLGWDGLICGPGYGDDLDQQQNCWRWCWRWWAEGAERRWQWARFVPVYRTVPHVEYASRRY